MSTQAKNEQFLLPIGGLCAYIYACKHTVLYRQPEHIKNHFMQEVCSSAGQWLELLHQELPGFESIIWLESFWDRSVHFVVIF